jgi:spermidine/putrescine transport system permease protein
MAALVPPAAPTGFEQPAPQRRSLTPYLLLAPGLAWLLIFFVIPTVTLAQTSLQEGSLQEGYQLTWRVANYTEALQAYGPQFLRSLWYASMCTILCLAIGYPLAYFIALRSGRFKPLMLLLVVMPLLGASSSGRLPGGSSSPTRAGW